MKRVNRYYTDKRCKITDDYITGKISEHELKYKINAICLQQLIDVERTLVDKGDIELACAVKCALMSWHTNDHYTSAHMKYIEKQCE